MGGASQKTATLGKKARDTPMQDAIPGNNLPDRWLAFKHSMVCKWMGLRDPDRALCPWQPFSSSATGQQRTGWAVGWGAAGISPSCCPAQRSAGCAATPGWGAAPAGVHSLQFWGRKDPRSSTRQAGSGEDPSLLPSACVLSGAGREIISPVSSQEGMIPPGGLHPRDLITPKFLIQSPHPRIRSHWGGGWGTSVPSLESS